jgi:hypothetical protein
MRSKAELCFFLYLNYNFIFVISFVFRQQQQRQVEVRVQQLIHVIRQALHVPYPHLFHQEQLLLQIVAQQICVILVLPLIHHRLYATLVQLKQAHAHLVYAWYVN